MMEVRKGALSDVKVLDMTRILAGPYCSMMFADMGADVIKLETKRGDDSRAFAPMVNGESAYYMNLNRGKKSITLDLKSEKGKELFRKLVERSDILLENFRPGTMEKLGLGYEELKKINPGLIYGCVSGFGQYGPYSNRGGYDIIGQAMGGLMSTTGWPGGEPTRTGTAMADVLAGMSVTIGVLAALNNQRRTGIGQKVDVALVDSVVSSLEIINQIYLVSGRIPERIGNRYESCYPYDSFKAKDGSIVIACGNDKLWNLLIQLMGKPELGEDERFNTNPKRVQNHAPLKVFVEDWLKDKESAVIVDELLNVGIPAAMIYTIEQVTKDHHIADVREMFVELEHPVAGKMKVTGNQVKMSETPVSIKTPAPTLGQHNEEVFKGILGLSDEEYEECVREGIF